MADSTGLTAAYDSGRQHARERMKENIARRLTDDFTWARNAFQGLEGVDIGAALIQFSRDRLDSDLSKYPEFQQQRAEVVEHRKGFAAEMNDPLRASFCLDWYWFISRRLNTRYVGKFPPPAKCTDFWFADNREGAPIHGSNRYDVLFRYTNQGYKEKNTARDYMKPEVIDSITCIGGVSSAVLCDEEPECLFPVNFHAAIPEGITEVKEFIGYLDRYKEFWGPGNQIWTDAKMNFAAVEKANVRMGVRYTTGCSAITACSYLTPVMNAFKKERDLISYQVRGWKPDDNPDAGYWAGAEARYRRLLELVQAENERGATLLGAARIALDHAVPFPARVNIQGQQGHPEETMQNWSMSAVVRCLYGPNMRSYSWIIDPDNPRPVYEMPCQITTGEDNAHRLPEWEAEIAAAGDIGG